MILEYHGFSDEDNLFRDQMKKFIKNERLLDEGVNSDKEGRELDNDIVQKAKEAGYFGVLTSQEHGGVGGTVTQYCILAEEISRACFALSNLIAVHTGLCTSPIINFATEEQKKKYLPKLATGELIGAIAMTEPNAGSNIAATQTTANLEEIAKGLEAKEEGEFYILNGTKRFITNAPNADIFFTVAYTGDRSKGPYGNMSAFIVEKAFPGVETGKDTGKKMGLNAALNSDVIFDDAKIPKSNLLGELGGGYKIQHKTMESGRIFLAACALGIAKEVFQRAVKYSKERLISTVPEQTPICDYQLNQLKIADMAYLTYCIETTLYNTAKLMDAGANTAGLGTLTKLGTDLGWKVVDTAMRLHGGYGYLHETGIERYMRELWISTQYEGTNDICKILAAKQILKNV